MSDTSAPARLHFDAIAPGDRFDLGSHVMKRDEVVEFASRYDPQPFHLDDDAAAAHPFFERLSASGWHTALVMHLLWHRYAEARGLESLAGAGVDQIRWLRPVYPGDTLSGEAEVLSVRTSRSNPGRGIGTLRTTLHNQHGEEVASMITTALFPRGANDDPEPGNA